MAFRTVRTVAFGLAAAALALSGARAQDTRVSLALPTTSLLYAYVYVAQAKGFWKEQGLDVDVRVLTGLATANALLGGSVDFGSSSGPTVLTAIARGQKPQVIATTHKRLDLELVVSKEFAEQAKLGPNASLADKAKALRGKTIATEAVNSVVHGFIKYILRAGGLDPEKDVTIAVIAGSATPGALMQKRVDAFANNAPWPSIAEREAGAVRWVSAPRGDVPGLDPFAMNTVMARQGYCNDHADSCRKLLAGIRKAITYIHEDPARAVQTLQPFFKDMDPGLLRQALDIELKTFSPDISSNDAAFEHAQELAAIIGQLKPTDKRTSFSEVYDNKYLQ
jgi:ABC-type nitrate/sulfonate/bicarbonate transport system substrate-binding protein